MGLHWKKTVQGLTSICLISSLLLTACSNTKNTEPSESPSPAPSSTATAPDNQASDSVQIVEPGSVTLRVGIQDSYYAPASLADNLPVFQEIEEKTGVKIGWEVTPPDQFDTVMKLKLSSATDLPDLIQIPGPDVATELVKYGKQGLLLPLEDLIEQHAPNIKKLFESDPNIEKQFKSPDGHIYGLSTLNYSPQMTTMIIRQDWLDKLSLKSPGTIDEWLTVLRAFKTQDPNGNNKADEIPLSAAGGINELLLFGNAFGLNLSPSGWWADSNGKISYEWMNEKLKDYLQFLNTLYTEGLLDPEFLNGKGEIEYANINNNMVGTVLRHLGNIPVFEGVLKESGVDSAKFVGTLPPSDASGSRYMHGNPLTSTFVAINKNTKHPEVAIKWLDYIYATEEGKRYMMVGLEGETYTLEDGKMVLTEAYLNPPAGVQPGRALGAESVLPHILLPEFFEAYWTAANPSIWEQANELQKYVIPAFPQIMSSEEELSKLGRIQNDIETYKNEMLAKFIVGRESLDNFGAYVEQLKKLGIEEIMAIKQQQYDRVSK